MIGKYCIVYSSSENRRCHTKTSEKERFFNSIESSTQNREERSQITVRKKLRKH